MQYARCGRDESILVVAQVTRLELEIKVALVRVDEVVFVGVRFGTRQQANESLRTRLQRSFEMSMMIVVLVMCSSTVRVSQLACVCAVKVVDVILARPKAVLCAPLEQDDQQDERHATDEQERHRDRVPKPVH